MNITAFKNTVTAIKDYFTLDLFIVIVTALVALAVCVYAVFTAAQLFGIVGLITALVVIPVLGVAVWKFKS